jgi:hypothetical protein
MPKGPPPAWNRRDCSFDHLVRAALQQGYGQVLVYGGIEDLDRAHAVRRGIYRCARHRGVTADAGQAADLARGDEMGIRRAGGGVFELRYRVWSKRQGRKGVLDRHGQDRAQWPYDPRRPATGGERLSWAGKDETGQPVIH